MQDAPSDRSVVLVIGCHRSGTSLITRSLKAMGLRLTDHLAPPAADNPKGFWEDTDVVEFNRKLLHEYLVDWDLPSPHRLRQLLNSDLSLWESEAQRIIEANYQGADLFAMKDPQLCLLLPFWVKVLTDAGIKPHFLIVNRTPTAVADSLTTRNGFTPHKGTTIWFTYNWVMLRSLPDAPVPIVAVDYRRFLRNPHHEMARINEFLSLGGSPDPETPEMQEFIDEFIDRDLCHHNSSLMDLEERSPFRREIQTISLFIDDLCNEAEPQLLREALQQVESLDDHSVRLEEALGRYWQTQEFAGLQHLRAELSDLPQVQAALAGWRAEAERVNEELEQRAMGFRTEQARWEARESNLELRIARLQEDLTEKDGHFKQEVDRLGELHSRVLERYENEVEQLQKHLAGTLRSHDEELEQMANDFRLATHRYRDEIERLEQHNVAHKSELSAIEASFRAEVDFLAKYRKPSAQHPIDPDLISEERLRELQRLSDEQDAERRALEARHEQLQSQVEALRAVPASFSYRLGRGLTWPLRAPYTALVHPVLRNREAAGLAARLAAAALRHPVRLAGLLSPRRVVNLFDIVYRKPELAQQVFGHYTQQIEGGAAGYDIGEMESDIDLDAFARETHFPEQTDPQVSVIIPVYNQILYTANCIKSIFRHLPNCSFEIIVADDCSSDATQQILPRVAGLRYVRNPQNLGFLRSCNRAVEQARGEFVFLLNNDTRVTGDWLDALVRVFDSHPDAGLVGSRLLYPDGRLQEAGGIVWQDGSAWNFGRLQDPGKPEFGYLKETDYVSGAAIMIRREMFEQLGGFDERFAPAYYEDTDLAFAVRASGYKVYLQPRSNIVHYEGISSGTDPTSGTKRYQAINQEKFREKWERVLNADHFANGEHVFFARDRSRYKRTVLVIDHYVPHFDRDAGSRSTWQYVRLLLDEDCNVKFIGDNFFRHEPYATALEDAGVELLVGNYYARQWKEWLRNHVQDIDVIYLHRPHIAERYLEALADLTPRPRLVYFGHDLHFLRVERQAEVECSEVLREEAEDWKRRELAIFEQVDRVYYPSQVEVDRIREEKDYSHVSAIPLYLFPNPTENDTYDPAERSGLIFVGGFGHKPNVDAILWFVGEILPIVRASIPDVRLHVVGSNMPVMVTDLADDGIIVDGFLTDDELTDLYARIRMSVVPLRYGAGVKGKVLESMYRGVPCITTPIGAEGIVFVEDALIVADSHDFARQLIDAYADEERLRNASIASLESIRRYYTYATARAAIASDFGLTMN